ncbi:LppU/SCO3897 family protein [Actinoplanes sp. CA-252034]|uniref:LppU/SCO3897 family protein n=1 Tax=Actinoplanes sp. CA-252034 TaxID=3239906 RepID=UPI003D97E4D5
MPGSPQFPGGDPRGGQPFPGADGSGAAPFPGSGPAMPGSPQFPGRFGASGDPSGPPYSEFTTDSAGRGPMPGGFPDQYNEHTTDVSGRGNSPYVPAPALPPMPGEQPGGGVYPGGPAARATVTPPGPEDTTSWPGPPEEQGKFDQFKADPPASSPAPSGKVNVRTIPVALAVVLGAALLLSLVFGLVYLISGDDFSVSQGDCVKRNGTTPVVAACTEPDTFQVVSIVTAKEQCGDVSQPYIVVPKDDGDQVLCLKKNG